MKELVVAIIGTGRIADFGHGDAAEHIPGIRVKYVCDLIKDKAEAYKAKYPRAEQSSRIITLLWPIRKWMPSSS
jgi:predicted dehydrogenase